MPKNIVFLTKSRSKVIDLVCLISCVMSLLSAWLGADSLAYACSMLGLAMIFLVAILFNFNSKKSLLRFFIPLTVTLFIVYMCFAFGAALAHQNYLVIVIVALAIYVKQLKGKLISIVTLILVSLLIYCYQRTQGALFKLPTRANLLSDFNVINPLIIVAAMCTQLVNAVNRSYRIIWKQKNDLRKSSKLKDEVLSILAHDMRAPFNSAKSILSFIEGDELSAEERKMVIGNLKNEIDLSVQTMENILEWASQAYYQSVSGRKTKIQRLDIAIMIDEVMMAFDHLAAKKNIKLENTLSSPTHVYADYQQMAFILRNLTSNALKFSYPNGKVHYILERHQGMSVISIRDSGRGMNTHTLSNLFRVDSRTSFLGTANEKGSGLGLILCKEFIESNQGKIWVESEPDQGTNVRFSIVDQEILSV